MSGYEPPDSWKYGWRYAPPAEWVHPQEDPAFRGTVEVRRHRGFPVYRSARGTFGFGVARNLDARGCYCPYRTSEGAEAALDAVLRLFPDVRPAFVPGAK